MQNIIGKLFSDYLAEQTVATGADYAALAQNTLQKEKELRNLLNEQQTRVFEELFELTSQIHFLEVKDAFYNACKLGASVAGEFVI